MIGLSLGGAFIRSWWKAGAGAALMFAPAFLLGTCSGARNERTEIRAEKAAADLKATEQARAADRALAGRKSASDATIEANRKASDEATAQIPDQAPSDRFRRDACFELRRSGQISADAPC